MAKKIANPIPNVNRNSQRSRAIKKQEIVPNLSKFYKTLPNSAYLHKVPIVAPATDSEHIINEVSGDYLRSLLKNKNLKIDKFKHGVNETNYFNTIPNKKSIEYELSLKDNQPLQGGIAIPDSSRAAHEITHVNSTVKKYEDKMWTHLNKLYQAIPKNQRDSVFNSQVKAVKNKINPVKVFSNQAAYNISPQELQNAITAVNNKKIPYYTENNNRIHTNHGKIDEFPAFIMQNLHNPWHGGNNLREGGKNPNPLPPDSRGFLKNILGEMGKAYPAKDNPHINAQVVKRKNSLDSKFASGGHVKDIFENYQNFAEGGAVRPMGSMGNMPSDNDEDPNKPSYMDLIRKYTTAGPEKYNAYAPTSGKQLVQRKSGELQRQYQQKEKALQGSVLEQQQQLANQYQGYLSPQQLQQGYKTLQEYNAIPREQRPGAYYTQGEYNNLSNQHSNLQGQYNALALKPQGIDPSALKAQFENSQRLNALLQQREQQLRTVKHNWPQAIHPSWQGI